MIRVIIALFVVAGFVVTLTPGVLSSLVDRVQAPWLDTAGQVLAGAQQALTSPVPWAGPNTSAAQSPARARSVQDFRPCKPAHVELSGFWEPTTTFEYFPADPPQQHPRRRDASVAGLHETAERMDVQIGLALRCLDERCQVCVSRVEGQIGYEPSRLSLRADLETNDCVRSHVLAHEQRHADVTRRAEARVLRRARELLAWVGRTHPGHFIAQSESDDGQRQVHAQIENALKQAHADASGYARRAHSFIDSNREAVREADAIRRDCGAQW